jgi:hypothetical protein
MEQGAFFQSQYFLANSKNSPHFMESEGNLLSCSQELVTYLHPLGYDLPSTSRSSKLSLSFVFLRHKPVCISLLARTCYGPYPSHLP